MANHFASAVVDVADGWDDGSKSNIIDGDGGTRWTSGAALASDTVWIDFAFVGPLPLCTIELDWEGASAQSYKVLVSDVKHDNSDLWTEVARYTAAYAAYPAETNIVARTDVLALPTGIVAQYLSLIHISEPTRPY